ncbi:redoxin domain-containing protein [bacterium]|nr:redoxin domain-containing protein [bacterium]
MNRRFIAYVTLALVTALLAGIRAAPAQDAESEQPEALQPIISREAIDQSSFYFSLPPRHGNAERVTFTDLVYEHNVVLMLWVTGCPLCKLEVRHLNKLVKWANEHPEAKLTVASVNFDALGKRGFEQANWDKAMLPQFEVYWDPGARHFNEEIWLLEEKGLPLTFYLTQGGLPVRIITGFSADLVKFAENDFLPKSAEQVDD